VTAKFFRGLGDPTRIRVLQHLSEGERTVGELVNLTGTLQGRLSSHLACLRWCGFVATRREGRLVYYRIADDRVIRLLASADEFIAEYGESVDVCRVIDGGD
jgi:DNA-binding transcriptional ArsR family regulator